MSKEIKKHEVFSYDVLGEFNHLYYKDLITENHCGEESFLVDAEGEKKFFYPLRYKKKIYALDADKISKLPIRVKEDVKIGHRTNVYYWITKFSSAIIKPNRTKDLNQVIKDFAPFEQYHSKPEHWFLYKLIVIALLNDKGFVRIATEAGFGKNSPYGILNPLTNKTVSINPRSAAAYEYRLIYPLINLDELTNLQPQQRDIMQDALLKTADWGVNYQKGTRGNKKLGTTDDMDISNLSIIITYNVLQHYVDSGQSDKYFDKVFQYAVHTRFLPFKFDGILNADAFSDIKNPKQVAKDNYDDLIELIKNITYYKKNIHSELHNYRLPRVYKFDKQGRQLKTFRKIVMYVDAASPTQVIFNERCEELYKCYTAYNKMISDGFGYESNEVRDVKSDKELTAVEK